jgi:hypothetical protein
MIIFLFLFSFFFILVNLQGKYDAIDNKTSSQVSLLDYIEILFIQNIQSLIVN